MFSKHFFTIPAVLVCLSSAVLADSLPDMKKVDSFIEDSSDEIGCYHYFAKTFQIGKQKKYHGILKLSGLLHKMNSDDISFAIGYGVGKIEFSLADKPELRKAVFKNLAKRCK